MEIYKNLIILCGFFKMLPLGLSVFSRYFQSFPYVYQTIFSWNLKVEDN